MADAIVAEQLGKDPTLPDVPVILGGRERLLCFDFNAIVQAEKATGINLLKGMAQFDASSMRGLLWAALLRDEPELSLQQVGAWIKPRAIPGLRTALMEAWFASADAPEVPAGEAGAQVAETPKA